MSTHETASLWTVEGRVRTKAQPDHAAYRYPGTWDRRTVVFAANDFASAYEQAEDALLANWSSAPHEAELDAVRPANLDDLEQFRFTGDRCYRVFIAGWDDDE